MSYSFPAFEEITSSFDSEILEYRTTKDKAEIRELDKHREVPVQFLITMKEELQASEEQNKNIIFAGACLTVQSWLHTNRGFLCSVGVLNSHLDTVLGVSKENPMSLEDKRTAALAFQTALSNRVYVAKDPLDDLLPHPAKKETDKSVKPHPFGCFEEGDGYCSLKSFVKVTGKLVSNTNQAIEKAAEKAEQKRLAEAAKKEGKSGGLLSWLSGGSTEVIQDNTSKNANGFSI